MERKEDFPPETRERAHKLLDANMEMLHEFPEGEWRCRHCSVRRIHVEFADECSVLLRCALTIAASRNNVVTPSKGCGVCGCRLVEIRGRHPQDFERTVCPTCCAERLDQINHISSHVYGVAAQATITPQSLIEASGHLAHEQQDDTRL
jgi:hypothetical protein